MAQTERARSERSARFARGAFIALALIAAGVPPVALVLLLPDYAIAGAFLGVFSGAGLMAFLWTWAAARDFADYQRLTAEGKLGAAGQSLEALKATLEALQSR